MEAQTDVGSSWRSWGEDRDDEVRCLGEGAQVPALEHHIGGEPSALDVGEELVEGVSPFGPEADGDPTIGMQVGAEPIEDGRRFFPYERDANLSRPWAIPGTKGLQHRVGGLEKADRTGNVSYDGDNHQHMTNVRQKKVDNIAAAIPPCEILGPASGDVLVVSWGGTYGSCKTAVERCQADGVSVSHLHLRWLNPFPADLGDVLKRFKKVLVPELNMGQLRLLLRAKFLVDAQGLNKVKGRPFAVSEVAEAIHQVAKS